MDFFKNIFAHIKPEKQQKQEPPPPPTVRQTTNEKSKQERRSRQASVSVKTEPTEQKTIEGKDEEKKEKRAKHPTKRAKDLLETSTEFEVVAAPLRPAVADEDKKPRVIQLVKRSKDQEEPMTDFEAVAVPSRPAVAKGQKKSAAMRLAKDQGRLKTDSELEVECTIESPPPSDSTARETPSRSSSGESPTATMPRG